MGPTCSFRKALRRRILDVVGVGLVAAPALAAGCGARVVVDLDGGVTGAGGGGGAGGAGHVTTGAGAGAGGVGGSTTGSCSLTSTGTGNNGQTQVTECFEPPATTCPSEYDATMYIVPSHPCVYLVSVDCGPVVQSGECCYLVTEAPQMQPQCHGRAP
jgi:hypothetical protein